MGVWIPDLSKAPAPIPLEPKLPEPTAALILVDCVECQGESQCDTCGSTGLVEVCGACLERPQVIAGNEACGCTFAHECENCGNFPAVTDGCCSICWGATLNRIKKEGDPDLERYLELKSRDLTPSEKALEIQAAKGYGWL